MGATNRRLRRGVVVLAVLAGVAACSDEGDIAQLPDQVPADLIDPTTTQPPDIDGPNVLLIIADDIGVDVAPCYAADAVPAPTLEALCDEGVVFDQVWSMPAGPATRATILTGRYGFRTGIGDQVRDTDVIPETELTLPRALAAADLPHQKANFGRWELGGEVDTPRDMGWDYFGGLFVGELPSYFQHTKYVNTVPNTITAYATTDQIDDAIDWIGHRELVPWLLWLATYAPREPFHVPPSDLHSFDDLSVVVEEGEDPNDPFAIEAAIDEQLEEDLEAVARPYYDAAVQALDTELGRLLDSIEPEVLEQTTIIFVGDNGSPSRLVPTEFDENDDPLPSRARGTIYEGGIHVPLIVAGAGVEDGGRRSDALVHTVDLFATILDLLGTSVDDAVPAEVDIDSVNLAPILENRAESLRVRLYSERFTDLDIRRPDSAAIRDERYKVIRFEDDDEDPEAEDTIEAYDLVDDPEEDVDIWEDATGDVRQRLDTLLAGIDSIEPA